jgi:predicted esterase
MFPRGPLDMTSINLSSQVYLLMRTHFTHRRSAMTNTRMIVTCGVLSLAAGAPARAADEAAFGGEWRTSFGIVKLKQKGKEVAGTYGDAGQFSLTGKIDDKTFTFEYQEGQAHGDGHWTIDESGCSFHGGYKLQNGQAGQWQGWRPDPEAPEGERSNVSGLWLTDLGLMELEQDADKVKGRYARRGVSEIKGTVTGRRLNFRYKSFRPGKGWFDLSASGDTLAGAAVTDGFAGWYGWRGRRAPEFARHARLLPGKIVDGSTSGLLTYSVRAPDGYQEGDGKKWPTMVILHGSNMNGEAYVSTIATAWPEIARDYLLIGINGESPSATGDDPQFNYTYINYVGRSTYQGFPGTDRESPALVAEALDDLREAYPVSKYFVGGHSQGGFLTYSLMMNFPEKIAGAFPISAGVILQCEPRAFADETLRAAQRSVSLAIIHGKADPLVAFSMGEYAARTFGEAGWPALRFFADTTDAGHRFGLLPVGEAIRWLEAQTSDDIERLLDFAERRMNAEGGKRDAVAALNRAGATTPELTGAVKARFERLSREIDEQTIAGAQKFLPKICDAQIDGKTWIDAFLAFRDEFEFAPGARELMEAFDRLRAAHNGPAEKLLNEANAAFQQGKRDDGYAKYQEILEKYFASSSYRNVKQWLAERR